MKKENLKVVKEDKKDTPKLTPMQEAKNFIEGFLEELKRQKKYVIFYCGLQMLERAEFLQNRLGKFLEEFDKKKMKDIKATKKDCEEFVKEFESELKDRDVEMLDNLKIAMNVVLDFPSKDTGIILGEELVIWDLKNSMYLDMIRVVNGEEGLKRIYLTMVDIAEQILAKNNIAND